MFQPNILKDKVILVTGGGTGLGKSMGKRFLELGAKLAIASRREEVLAATAKELQEATGGEVFYTTCDVRNPEQVEQMMDAVWKHYGTIDVLLNNAAGNFAAPTESLSHRAVDAVLNIVLHGTWYCTLALGKNAEYHRDIRVDGRAVCRSFGYCQSRGDGADAITGRRMGQVWNSDECDCARTISDRRRGVAFESDGKF
jgi:hypothetical protein